MARQQSHYKVKILNIDGTTCRSLLVNNLEIIHNFNIDENSIPDAHAAGAQHLSLKPFSLAEIIPDKKIPSSHLFLDFQKYKIIIIDVATTHKY